MGLKPKIVIAVAPAVVHRCDERTQALGPDADATAHVETEDLSWASTSYACGSKQNGARFIKGDRCGDMEVSGGENFVFCEDATGERDD